jgi:subtilisin family serine protease
MGKGGPIEDFPLEVLIGTGCDERVLRLREGELLFGCGEDVSPDRIDQITEENGLAELPATEDFATPARLRSESMRWVRILSDRPPLDMAVYMRTLPEVWLAAPVYQPLSDETPSNAAAPILDTFIVELGRKGVDRARRAIEGLGLVEDEVWSRQVEGLRKYRLPQELPTSGFELLRRIAEIPGVATVEPDWLRLDPIHQTPGPLQWNLGEIGIQDAWRETSGTGVCVAVIDTGFQLDHPKLSGSFTDPSTHAHYPGSDGPQIPGDVGVPATNRPPPDGKTTNDVRWHGTAVAGVIAASAAGADVTGVAPGCKILPIRVSPMTDSNVAAALGYAAQQGAKVANLSISGGGPTFALQRAIESAWPTMLVCAAAGNAIQGDSSVVAYPAAYALVIAVGACIKGGLRKDLDTPDGEKWFSRYGTAIDVMAPGIGIPSTDWTGSAGYNASGELREVHWYKQTYQGAQAGDDRGDYIWVFTGTSAATAHVSALAGLIFAKQPAWSAKEVRERIVETCEKLPNAKAYPLKKDGETWSAQLGHGRINAALALA